jgi:hypothetical protein
MQYIGWEVTVLTGEAAMSCLNLIIPYASEHNIDLLQCTIYLMLQDFGQMV